MKKYKFLIAFLIVPMLISACSCKKDSQDRADFEIKKREEVKDEVTNWAVYTNPAFRYELRFPTDWNIENVEQRGEEVMFYPKDRQLSNEYKGDLRILGFSNWKEHLRVDEFIKTQAPQNYYAFSNAKDKEIIEFRGYYAEYLKNVEIEKDKFIDVMIVDTQNWIIVLELRGNYDTLTNIVGSMYFY